MAVAPDFAPDSTGCDGAPMAASDISKTEGTCLKNFAFHLQCLE
jgi:hypothetical protein